MATLSRPGASDTFECGLCLHVLRGRIAETVCCGKVYCWDCLEPVFLKPHRTCPNCRKGAGNFKRQESRALARVLNDEAATCDHCMAEISYGDKDTHVTQCEEVKVQCGNHIGGKECDWKGKRKMFNHHKDICDKIIDSTMKAIALCGGGEKINRSYGNMKALLTVQSNDQVPLSPESLYFELKNRGILLHADHWESLQYVCSDSFLHDLLGHCDFGGNRGNVPTVAATGNETIPLQIAKLYQVVIEAFTIKDVFSDGPTRNSLTVCRHAFGTFSMSRFISQGGRGGEPRKPEQWSAWKQASFLSDCEKGDIPHFIENFEHRVVKKVDRFIPAPQEASNA